PRSEEHDLSSQRAAVGKQVRADDFEAHYDLGIAFKEMERYDDAIHEFKLLMNAPGRAAPCHTMIGLCYTEKGMQSEAINQFKQGLYVDGITDVEQLSLYYELGSAYVKLEDLREALYYYEKVAKKDPQFRDAARRVSELRSMITMGHAASS